MEARCYTVQFLVMMRGAVWQICGTYTFDQRPSQQGPGQGAAPGQSVTDVAQACLQQTEWSRNVQNVPNKCLGSCSGV